MKPETAAEREVRILKKNADTLASFVAFCKANPRYRFWQALLSWSEYQTISVRDKNVPAPELAGDTFYFEGRRHDEK